MSFLQRQGGVGTLATSIARILTGHQKETAIVRMPGDEDNRDAIAEKRKVGLTLVARENSVVGQLTPHPTLSPPEGRGLTASFHAGISLPCRRGRGIRPQVVG